MESVDPSAASPSTYVFTTDHVLYSKLGPNRNKVVCPDRPGLCTTELIRLCPDPKRLSRNFLTYYLRSEHYMGFARQVVAGAKMPRMVMDRFWEFEIPLPPLPEQHRIVEILDQADTLRQQRRKADQRSQKILPALFHGMFGDVRLNPHSWPLETLQSLGRVVTGSTPPSKLDNMYDGPIPFVTPADLKETWVRHNRSLTRAGAAQSRTVRSGSAFVCCIGATIGKMGKAIQESAFNQQINAVEWFDDSCDSYGLEALKQIRDQIISGASSTTLPIINKSTFQALKIPLPPRDLRERFAERVANLESSVGDQATSTTTLETLFQTLLHRAFDGSLTAKWREGAAKEVLQEMNRQSRI
ncbi:MAG: restriction endonuclease subunit S [Verrucomicrobia bacterium]|nr:restriction endonuclease subunit S [Verrucomicrobiota bacterium]